MSLRVAAVSGCCCLASVLLLSCVTFSSASDHSKENVVSIGVVENENDVPNRSVQMFVDTTMTHNTVDYNVVRFNCATWVHFLLQGYGIHCDYLGGAVALPDCKCAETFGCSGIGSGSDLIKKYMEIENKTNETGNPARMTMHVSDGGVRKSLYDAKSFEMEVVRTLVPQIGSYHVSVLARWLEESQWKMISFSGWPYDTIHSWSTIGDLFTGHFTVAFPDPTMRRAFQDDQQKNLKVMASLNDTLESVVLPKSSLEIKEVSAVKRHPHFGRLHLLQIALEGQDTPLSFMEISDSDKFFRVLSWHVISLARDEDDTHWVYQDPEQLLVALPLETAIIEFKGMYFMQRPLISHWFRTLFTVLLNGAKWTPSVRPSNNTDTAETMSMTPSATHSSMTEFV